MFLSTRDQGVVKVSCIEETSLSRLCRPMSETGDLLDEIRIGLEQQDDHDDDGVTTYY
jgi:wyosine [tRNA(Phe)-imidazoG37] synthetase (radical SAM superfamily)